MSLLNLGYQPPVAVAYGAGVDSTALLLLMKQIGMRPDAILNADMGPNVERQETNDYIPIMNSYLDRWGFPHVTRVRYEPQDFKHWPPYRTLYENCLTNGTLPSVSFGFHSCSKKWKIGPQNKWCKAWPMAQECWDRGERVIKLIGYDAGPRDSFRRCNHQGETSDKLYEYRYLLQEHGWDRARCIEEIRREGMPVPVKSSCVFCGAIKTHEVRSLPAYQLRMIVIMEARAKPRLHTIEGLWRKAVKGLRGATPRPGSMTEFIEAEGLLPKAEIQQLQRVPTALLNHQADYASGKKVDPLSEFVQIHIGEVA